MDLNVQELGAVALVGGVAAEVLPQAGRLVVTPHPVTVDGQTNVPVDLQPGESLAAFLARHVPGIESGAWVVSIGGCSVPQALWARTYPKHGQLIAARCVVRRQVLSLVAIAALTYFSGGIAASLYGAAGGTFVAASAGLALSAIQAGVVLVGSMLINKVLAPKVPDAATAAAQKQVYSLTSQRNTARPYEPMPVLLGVMRVTPDLAAQPYAWYEGDDQYLGVRLLGGVNVHAVSDIAIGDTPIGNFADAAVYLNGFPGMASVPVPLHGNVDAVAGAALPWDGGSQWVTRTSSAGVIALQVDIEGRLYDSDPGSGTGLGPNATTITLEYRAVGAAGWTAWRAEAISNNTTDTLRYTWQLDVPLGRYEVRARVDRPTWADPGDVCEFAWAQLKSIQPDTTDYSQWGCIGIRIRASGQLSGGLDTVRATYTPRPLPVWTPGGWINATTMEQGACNPGALVLQVLRGIRAPNGTLQFGLGLADDQIDIDGLKAFMLHCTARGYTYSKWITSAMSIGAVLEEIALAGMGQYMWIDGSRPTVQWVASGQPTGGVVNMANIRKGSFSVAYNLAQAADGIEYSYLDRSTWETTTLRVSAPGVVSPLNPARITGEGITMAAHAAVMARYHLAQSLYQYKTIAFGADIEHLDYRRLSVLSISHDMTQWGFGGRVIDADIVVGKVVLTLDEPVPALATPFIGLRIPGERDYRVFRVAAFDGVDGLADTLTLVEPWPNGVALPGAAEDNPAHDTLWCYDFKPTPGLRVRVVSMRPQQDLEGADVAVVQESEEFWDYVYNGNYVPAPGNSSLPQLARPKVRRLQVTEQTNLQGDTEWYELRLSWDVEGAADHCQVWAALDGQQLRLVDAQATGNRSVIRIDAAGEWLIEVRPFDASGRLGELAYTTYGTAAVDLPPRNVDTFAVTQVAGELRRFVWAYANGQRPGNLAGVQIRYTAGERALSVADWDALTPILGAGDIYSGELETTRPDAGRWTFAVRAINTAGRLANGVRTYTITLQAPLASITDGLDDLTKGLDDTLGLITGGQPVAQMPKLPAPLVPLVLGQGAQITTHTTLLAAQGANINDAAEQLLQSVLAFGDLQQRMSDAGIVVDPATGTVRIYGVEANAEKVSALQILIDGIKGQLQLKATTQYVDAKIAQAVLGVADLALFEGMDARIHVVEVDLDSVKGEIKLLASSASVQGLAGRVGTAEQRLDAQAGQILARVTTAQFEAAQGAVNGRLATAEQQLEALGDAASIRQSIVVASQNSKAIAGVGEILLRNLLADWKADNRQRAEAASATSDLRVRMDEGLLAEATSRQQLAAALRDADAVLSADVKKEATARATKDEALAQDVAQLTATVTTDRGTAAAGLASEATARATKDDALTQQLQQLTATVTTDRGTAAAGLAGEATARATKDDALTQQLQQLTATVTTDRGTAAAGLAGEATARATKDDALTQQLQQLTATVTTDRGTAAAGLAGEATARASKDDALAQQLQTLTSTVNTDRGNNSAALASEASARASKDDALTQQLQALTSTVNTDRGNTSAALASEASARASKDDALTQQLQTLTSTVNTDRGNTSAALASEASARASKDDALTQQLQSLTATVGDNKASATTSLQALASEQSAQASQLSGLSATVGGHSASISQYGQALAGLDGRFSATWGLSVIAGKYVGGMAINNNGQSVEMVFLADRFAFARRVNDEPRYLLTGGQVNGVDTVGIGGDVVLDGAMRARHILVQELSAFTARLGYVNAGRMDIASDGAGGWGYVRSANKWLGDGGSGFIFARSDWGDVIAEIQAGAMRLSMHRDGGYMRLEGPWGRLDNNGMEINQVNVIGALQIRGEEITRIRAQAAPYRQQSSQEQIDIGGYDPGGAWVLAGITCSVRTPDQGGDSSNSLRPEFFNWEIWRDGALLAAGGPDIGFTEVVLPADSGAKTYTLFVRGAYIMRAVFSLKAFRR